MRLEQELREYRNGMYRVAIMMKQQDESMSDLVMIFINEMDWVLGDKEHGDLAAVVRLFAKRDEDSKKLALF
jgi:hypothetical protein